MMNSQTTIKNFLFTARTLALLVCVGLMAMSIAAQTAKAPTANPAGNLDQCRNGTPAPGVPCTGSAWVNGNVGAQNASWAENDFLPYRDVMSNLSPGTSYTMTLGYGIIQGGKHAIDYLGTYNATNPADPCDSNTLCTLASPTSTFAIPQDNVTVTNNISPNTGTNIVQKPGVFTMWGGTITGVAYTVYDNSGHRQIVVTFTANTASPVLSWSGHVAWIGDWGIGNSAGGISGSPYHMSQDTCSFGCGAQDRSLAAAAVTPSGAVFIKKTVVGLLGQTTAVFSWPFAASTGFTPTNFSLIANGTSSDTVSSAISNFPAGSNTATITVTECTSAALTGCAGTTYQSGWTLSNLSCVESGLQDTTTNGGLGPTATIGVQIGEVVTCTFQNSQLTPSAAPASINGRVVTIAGSGIRGATVRLVDVNTGLSFSAITNSFGYYAFEDLPTEDFYMVSVTAKGYKFVNSTMSFTLLDNLTDLDFVAAQ